MRRAILAALGGTILGASAASAQLPQASAATPGGTAPHCWLLSVVVLLHLRLNSGLAVTVGFSHLLHVVCEQR